MKALRKLLEPLYIFYSPRYPKILVYMLQSTEYQAAPYLAWYWRTQNFAHVMKRRELVQTKAARLLYRALSAGMLLEIAVGLLLIYLGLWHGLGGGVGFGLALIIAYPIIWAHLAIVPLVAGRELVARPNEKRLIATSEQIFKAHSGARVAIAGSYGKTSMKELLLSVLSHDKKVAATPANKNVAISHAHFARKLTGDEDILLIEYGEGAPGDVARFSRTTHPTHGVITGLAPAHLDHYKTLHAAGEDIFSLAKYLKNKNVFVNGEAPSAQSFIEKEFHIYDRSGALGWKVSGVKLSIEGTHFTLTKGNETLRLHSQLLGRHQLGPLSLAAALAHDLGLSDKQIIAGINKTAPFEHRMQPYQLSGAWVIDDTYNGNIEGIRAGTELLAELPAKRKLYVSPGLVDQGEETERVHLEMGRLIAAAQPDIVVLMQNSVTTFIQQGLQAGNFKGELRIESNPLDFYTNLTEFVAAGDLVLMQNDWTDNYA